MTHLVSQAEPLRAQGGVKDPDALPLGEVPHRDYSVTSFIWQIDELQALKAHVEDKPSHLWAIEAEMEDPYNLPYLLKQGILIAEGWYKLDVARTIPTPHSPKSTIEEVAATNGFGGPPDATTLSLYISSLSLDGQSYGYSYTTSIFIGIKASSCGVGNRFAETKWVWTTTADFEWSQQNDYCGVELPRMSTLLENQQLAAEDSFSLCVQIGSPADSKPAFVQPDQIVVPRSIIDGLGGLFDSTTGDVKFVCLEHVPSSEGNDSFDRSLPNAKPPVLSRKRVLIAHAEILKMRGDYFNALLTGGFAETDLGRRSDSRRITIVVDDADFVTVYWLLKFIYTNKLEFAMDEDVRFLMQQLAIDRSEIGKLLSDDPGYSGPSEWDLKHLPMEGDLAEGSISELDFDARTVHSQSSVGTSVSRRVSIPMSPPSTAKDAKKDLAKPPTPIEGDRSGSPTASTTVSKSSSGSTASSASKTSSKCSANTASSATPTQTRSTATNAALKPSTTARAPASSKVPAISKSQAPSQTRTPFPMARTQPEADPHSHPSPAPQPASALSVYMLSHRYRLNVLEGLAKDHILGRMTYDNCMPMLLASHRYEELHADVLDYVVDRWPDVQRSSEFLRCIQEISAGVWGEAGGLVLHRLFQRL